MVARLSNGMSKIRKGAEKFGTTAWIEASNPTGTSGPTMNYIHNNPVHHGYVKRWQDWPWSRAADFLERVGHETAMKLWREYPPLDYGKTWDFD